MRDLFDVNNAFGHNIWMAWNIKFNPTFDKEFQQMSPEVQDELRATLNILSEKGPQLGRPHADTLKGSRHSNMKELRLRADGGVWRFAFAFDPNREGIMLVGGAKQGMSQSLFYDQLIDKADKRFDQHLAQVKEQANDRNKQQNNGNKGHKGHKR